MFVELTSLSLILQRNDLIPKAGGILEKIQTMPAHQQVDEQIPGELG